MTRIDTVATATARAALEGLLQHRETLLEYVDFEEHTRWYWRLPARWLPVSGVEVWLLSWLPGQESRLHDHGGSSGAFAVLLGDLDETVVTPDGMNARDHRWQRGTLRSFGVDHIHRVGNDGARPAVSLHAYRPALSRMRRFARFPGGLRELTIEHAGADW